MKFKKLNEDTNKSTIEQDILAIEDINEFLKVVNIETHKEPSMVGPMYLLKDGSFIYVNDYVSKNKYDSENNRTHTGFIGLMMDEYIKNKYNFNPNHIYLSPHTIRGILEEKGLIRLNTGSTASDKRFYMCLPSGSYAKPTYAQYNSLLEFLDLNTKEVWVYIGNKWDAVSQKYVDFIPEDIIKKIKRYYASGNLYESLNESKQDIEKFKQWAGFDLYNRFIKQKPRLEPRKRDIYYWMKNSSKEQLDKTLSELENIPSRRTLDKDAKKGAELIYSDNEWDVYKINTYEASVKYGNGTTWCISGKNNGIDFNGKDSFNAYNKYSDIYFFINKKINSKKYALVIDDKNYWTLYNDADFVEVGSWCNYGKDDTWSPSDSSQPHFPNIQGLPNINDEYKKAKKVLLDESLLIEVYPNKGESKKDFTKRFMSVTKDEYPDVKQRYAVCMSYWNRRNKKRKNESLEEDFNSFRQTLSFPLLVFRGIYVESEDKINKNDIGVSWTTNPNLFISSDATLGDYIPANECNYILSGYVNENDIDWESTEDNWYTFSDMYWNDEDDFDYDCECEITLKRGVVPNKLEVQDKKSFYDDLGFNIGQDDFDESLDEDTITLYTVQDKKVLDKLNKGETYIADYNNIFDKDYIDLYKKLSSLYNFKNCPIFCVDEDSMHVIGSSGIIEGGDKILLKLNVPISEVKYHDYYDWTDYLFFSVDDDGTFENEEDQNNYVLELEDNIKNQKCDTIEDREFVIDRIEPSWLNRDTLQESYNNENEEYWYRGYNSKYGIFDNRVEDASLYTWVTDSLEYANEYAKHNYGKVAKIKLKCSDNAIGGVLELPEYIDYYEPGDEAFKEYILDNDFKGYGFEIDDWNAYCLCISKDVCEVVDADVKLDNESLQERTNINYSQLTKPTVMYPDNRYWFGITIKQDKDKPNKIKRNKFAIQLQTDDIDVVKEILEEIIPKEDYDRMRILGHTSNLSGLRKDGYKLLSLGLSESLNEGDNTLAPHTIRSIMFKTEGSIEASPFTDFIEEGLSKLDENIYIYFWHDSKSHDAMLIELGNKYNIIEERTFTIYMNSEGTINEVNIDKAFEGEFAPYKEKVIAKAKNYLRTTR